MKRLIVLSLPLCVALAVEPAPDERQELVEKMDAYYQSQFADLELTKQGQFGVSRVETSNIKAHGREGGDPGYRRKDLPNAVQIYGAKGKALKPEAIELRYTRLPNQASFRGSDTLGFAKKTADALAKGKKGPFTSTANGTYMEARPVRLSKPECLSCHVGMKRDQPAAIMVYSVHSPAPKR